MKTLKKALALLLVLSMSLSLMSVAAFADDEIIDEPATVEEPAAEETPSETDTTDETAGEVPTETPEEPAEETTEETTEATEEETTEATPEETEELADETEEPAEAETPEEPTEEEPAAEEPAEDAEEEPAEEEPAEEEPTEEEPAAEEPAEEEIVEETMPVEETVEEPEAKPAEEIVEELPAPVEQPVLTEEELAAQAEAERLAAEEAARLEAERLAAEEAARLEAERLAALERRWPKSDKELVFDTESYRVTVTVPESAFADHVYFRVIEMQWAELDEATAELLKASGLTEDDALLDIGFEDADGFEVEPDAAIGVSIEAAEAEIAEVYHVEDEETVAKVAEEVETVATFEVGSFSLFVVKSVTTQSGNELRIVEEADGYVLQPDEIRVYRVSEGFYQDNTTYPTSTNFYITSLDGLKYFRDLVSNLNGAAESYLQFYPGQNAVGLYSNNLFTDKTVHLLADIELNNEPWTPIGYEYGTQGGSNPQFYGDFDGHGHTVSNLNLAGYETTNAAKSELGFFGALKNSSTISNLTLNNVKVEGSSARVGAFAGFTHSSKTIAFHNCKLTGTVSLEGTSGVGGFVGYGYTLRFENCSIDASGSIAGKNAYASVGYFTGVGAYSATFDNSSVSNSVVATENEDVVTKWNGSSVAKIDDTEYPTLTAAIAAAQSGDTIDVLADTAMSEVLLIGKSVTINGNGHEFKNSANRIIRITANNLTVNINNWVMTSVCIATSDVRGISFDKASSGSSLTLDGCTLSASFYALNVVTGPENLSVTIKNGTVAAGWAAINSYSNNSTFTIENSTLRGLNDKGENSWNNFSTIVFDGYGLWDGSNVGKYGSGNNVAIRNSTVYAETSSSNNQAWLGVQYGARGNTVSVDSDSKLINAKGEDQSLNYGLSWYCNWDGTEYKTYYTGNNRVDVEYADGRRLIATGVKLDGDLNALEQTITLPATSLTKENHSFAGWSIYDTQTGTTAEKVYKAGDSYTTGKNFVELILTPTWTINTYTVNWVIDGVTTTQTYEYGTTPSRDDPTKTANAQYTYTFKGWTPKIVAVTGDATYTAQFNAKLNPYTVRFLNWDNTVLSTQTVAYGKLPTAPATPTRAADGANTYTFSGWDKTISPVTGNVDYKATFTSAARTYTVEFRSYDGTVLQSASVGSGEAVTYSGTPTRENLTAGDKEYTFTFTGWATRKGGEQVYAAADTLPAATEDATYWAVFATTEGSTVQVTTANAAATDTVSDVTTTGSTESTITTIMDEGTTTTVTESTTETTGTKSDNGVAGTQDTAATVTKTTEVKVTDSSGTVTTSSVEVKTTETETYKAESQSIVYTAETKTETTTTPAGSGESTKTTDSVDKTTVTLKAEPTTTNTASAGLTLASVTNEVEASKVDVSTIVSNVLEQHEDSAVKSVSDDGKTKETKIEVQLELKADLTATTTAAAEITTVTYDVKPYAKVVDANDGNKVLEENIAVANTQLVAAAAIPVKLPIPDSFASASTVRIKHSSTGYDDAIIEASVKGESGAHYAEFTVDHFSSFEIVSPSTVLVTIDNGTTKTTTSYVSGATVPTPPTPSRSGYTFTGWSPAFSATATADVTYTAQWRVIEYSSDDNSSDDNSSGSTAPQTTTIVDESTPLSEFPIFYVDVADGSWYHDAIAYVTALELMNGVGDNHFAPNDNTTRGMVAVVMMRLANGEAVDLDSFFDVADSAYYAEAAAWAVENGVFKGYDDGSFRGEINITREQFAAVLYRYALAKGYDVSAKADLGAYDDGALVGGYASDAMAWAIANGIIKGVGGNRLDPLGNATRAQLAAMLMRFDALTKDVV